MFAIDRAGLVGQDGPTSWSIRFSLSSLYPNIVIEHHQMKHLQTKFFPVTNMKALRQCVARDRVLSKINDAIEVRSDRRICVRGKYGNLELWNNIIRGDSGPTDATVVDMKWVKPLDTELIKEIASNYEKSVTIEDGSIAGELGAL